MGDVDRTVIGSKWRRWHPVDPVQMKRHGDDPKSSSPEGKATAKQSPANMEKVNGRFGAIAASSPCFRPTVASISQCLQEFRGLVRPYVTALLTMIKIVLIATISFASPSQ